jgi:AcrR family transcriptional regulator
MSDVRMPTQKRSIEKRNRIIEKGFELMCENGYYNTTIPDIAKNADVSVGIIYQYFNDKKDIFIEGVKNYSNNIMYPMINILETREIKIKDLKSVIESMIDNFIKTHTITKRAHEELMAMSHLDEDVANIFNNSELEMTDKIVMLLESNNIYIINAREKVHIVIGLIDNLCHEIVYHKHKSFDYNKMKEEVINIIVDILK